MKAVKKDSDFKTSLKVGTKTDLVNIYLSECKAWRSIDSLAYDKVQASVKFHGELLEDQNTNFLAKATLSTKGLTKGEPEEKEIVSIECEYILTYSLRDRNGLSKEEIERFCNINAVYNVWPYWRELIQNISNRMEIPTLTLPLFRIRERKMKEKKTKKYE
jgi:preprotein translocase subunit SecB